MTTATAIANDRYSVRSPNGVPAYVNGHRIGVHVYDFDGQQYVSVRIGNDVSFGGRLPDEIRSVDDLFAYAIASARTYASVVTMDAPVITHTDRMVSDSGMISYCARSGGWMIGTVFNHGGRWSSAYDEDGTHRTRKALVKAMLDRRNV